jgi:Rod binding domain-containing protein
MTTPAVIRPTVTSAAPPPTPQAGANELRLRQASRDFEAHVLGALLQPMFEGLGQGGLFGGGSAEAQWRPMLVAEYGRAIARAGGVGLADSVLATLQRMQHGPGQ